MYHRLHHQHSNELVLVSLRTIAMDMLANREEEKEEAKKKLSFFLFLFHFFALFLCQLSYKNVKLKTNNDIKDLGRRLDRTTPCCI
jgi:predicted membrane channel-forming protein YqfA (hemolysin III family)